MKSDPRREAVILVHGLWMSGLEMNLLRQRLQSPHGFDVRGFSYPTLHGDTFGVVEQLLRNARELAAIASRVHLVGHSLGGAIVYRAMERCSEPWRGNAVVLGSPLNGSQAVRGVSRWSLLRPLLGPHAAAELAEPQARAWRGPGALGAIAGSAALGTGQLFAHFTGPHDGTVAVEETRIPGLNGHIILPHSHMGLLFAQDVAEQTAHFLRHGAFHTSTDRSARAS
jgi:alpha-beta hydrolase superfamily lysophospholipase